MKNYQIIQNAAHYGTEAYMWKIKRNFKEKLYTIKGHFHEKWEKPQLNYVRKCPLKRCFR